jgi:hypothetical protein
LTRLKCANTSCTEHCYECRRTLRKLA